MSASHCLNCNTTLQPNQNFCSVCGQGTSTHRFSLKGIFGHDFIHSVFHLDKGFLYTFKMLFTKPGFFIKEYLEGKRVKYFNYFTMILILIAIGHFANKYSPIRYTDLMKNSINKSDTGKLKIDTAALIGKKSSLNFEDIKLLQVKIDSLKKREGVKGTIQAKIAEEQQKIFESFDRFPKENPKLFYIILLPIYTIVTFMWFYKSKLNFSEQLILNIYKTCADIVVGILITLGFYIYPKISFWVNAFPFATLVVIVYGTWIYYDFFKLYYKDKTVTFLKSLAAVITVQLLIGVASVVYMVIKLIQSGVFKPH
jgi:hypothetical protein